MTGVGHGRGKDAQVKRIGDQAFDLLPMLRELEVSSSCRHASSDGSLHRFVKPEMVMEIRITDVQSEDSRGDPTRRRVLEYDQESWRGIALMPGVSILHPVFQRLRKDETVNRSDIRAEQVLDRCLARDATTEAVVEQLSSSEVIRRAAYPGTTKGKLAVRKLLVWKTNNQGGLEPGLNERAPRSYMPRLQTKISSGAEAASVVLPKVALLLNIPVTWAAPPLSMSTAKP